MAVNISGLRRNIKNVAHNYTDTQVKVREATSNDPWGPSSTQMSEIADLTYNVVAFSEIMQMIWKRLNDHGKNWRHVYKSLVLLEYLIKTGSDKVAQQCKENIFAIQTLKDFQYLDDNKDQGINVREKAKSLVALLKDDERLRNERVRALKAKERFAQATAGIGSDTVYNYHRETRRPEGLPENRRNSISDITLSSDLEAARPQTVGEEELQLQLALAMSREEAEQEETKIKSDDMRLQLALQKSKEQTSEEDEFVRHEKGKPSNDLLQLEDIFAPPQALPPPAPIRTSASSFPVADPWGTVDQGPVENDPWTGTVNTNSSVSSDPWSPVKLKHPPPSVSPLGQSKTTSSRGDGIYPNLTNDPWNPVASQSQREVINDPVSIFSAPSAASNFPSNDPWSALTTQSTIEVDPFSPQAKNELNEFDLLREEANKNQSPAFKTGSSSPNPFDLSEMRTGLQETGAKPKKGVQSIMQEHSNLVNLDNLLSSNKTEGVRNPFEQQPPNPFQASKTAKPALNQLMSGGNTSAWPTAPQPAKPQPDFNPFF